MTVNVGQIHKKVCLKQFCAACYKKKFSSKDLSSIIQEDWALYFIFGYDLAHQMTILWTIK